MNFTAITAYLNIQRQSTTRSLQGNDSCSSIGRYIKHDIVEVKIITVSKVFCYDSVRIRIYGRRDLHNPITIISICSHLLIWVLSGSFKVKSHIISTLNILYSIIIVHFTIQRSPIAKRRRSTILH